jgi:nucleotide-binding universal stress UspA family protein
MQLSMKTILLPTDFSAPAIQAAKYAAALASQNRDKLLLVHVQAPETAGAPDGVLVSLPPDPRLEVYYQQKLRELAQQLQLDYGFLFQPETICAVGNLPEQLNEIIRREQVDLVVMGTKGAHQFLEKLIGTNTAGFIKQAICPVLIIPESAGYAGIKTIAYASDFDTGQAVYLQQLLAFAQPYTPTIYILNVVDVDKMGSVPDINILQQIQKKYPDINLSIAQTKEDDVVTGIRQFVQDNQVDILAVSVQIRPFQEEIFHHSITRQLAFGAPVPLLALPPIPYRLQPMPNFDQPAAHATP